MPRTSETVRENRGPENPAAERTAETEFEPQTQEGLIGEEVYERTHLLNEVSVVRDESSHLHERVTDLHQRVRETEIDERTTTTAALNPRVLLSELSEQWGLSWALIARLGGVSPTAIRKWRRGEPMTPENRRAVARLVAVLELAASHGSPLVEPASWLEMPISDTATLTPSDLYLADRVDLLLDLVCANTSPHQVLSEFDPNWRQNYARDARFEVIEGSDGHPMIAERT